MLNYSFNIQICDFYCSFFQLLFLFICLFYSGFVISNLNCHCIRNVRSVNKQVTLPLFCMCVLRSCTVVCGCDPWLCWRDSFHLSSAVGSFFLDPTLMSRLADLLGVKRAVWASMSELPQALSSTVSLLAAHSFSSELMTTKSGLCKPITEDKKHRLCVSNPLIQHKGENHIESICLVCHF